jgi:14-3-3 protein epsilon
MSKEIFDEFNELMANAKKDPNLSPDDQTLLSEMHNEIIEDIQGSWQELISNEKNRMIVDKEEFQSKNQKICEKIITIIDECLDEKFLLSYENKVFYYEMKGDYFRCLVEFQNDDKAQGNFKNKAEESYKKGLDIANQFINFKPNDPIRLGLVLKFSAFYNEIFGNPDKASDIIEVGIKEYDPHTAEQDAIVKVGLLREYLKILNNNRETTGDDDADN